MYNLKLALSFLSSYEPLTVIIKHPRLPKGNLDLDFGDNFSRTTVCVYYTSV